MSKVKTTLIVEAEETISSFSNSKNYSEEKVTKYVLDEGVASEFYEMHSFSPSAKSANSSAAPKAFCIYNHGTTGAETFELTLTETGVAGTGAIGTESVTVNQEWGSGTWGDGTWGN